MCAFELLNFQIDSKNAYITIVMNYKLKLHCATEYYVLNHNIYARGRDKSIMNR